MDYFIRNATAVDYESLAEIWLTTSKDAHYFVPGSFWEERKKDLIDLYLPNSLVWVCTNSLDLILGFIALRGTKIEALFILPEEQGKGIGKLLIDVVKVYKEKLNLHVYEKNSRAISFYKNQRFEILNRIIEKNTNEWEYVMRWRNN